MTGHDGVLSAVLTAAHLVVAAICAVDVLRARKRTAATILWILTVFYLPWLGPLLYLLIGVNRVRRRIEERQSHRAQLVAGVRRTQLMPIVAVRGEVDHPSFTGGCPEVFREFFRLLDNLTNNPAVPGNRCTLLRGGEEVYGAMCEAIAAAERHVHLMTYILDDDEAGHCVLDALAERAAAGVEVRVLVDGIGGNSFSRRTIRRYRGHGVDLRFLRQLQPLRGRFAINLRNHRKILVVDGQRSFTGGMNISARHLLERASDHQVLDHHTRVDGPAAAQLQRTFAEDWFDVTGEPLLRHEYFPRVAPAGDDMVRTINTGPDREDQAMLRVFNAAIQTAGRSIRIVTPYFVPDPSVVMLLQLAALGGVDVAIVVPRFNNYAAIKYASRYRYAELLATGVRIFEREAPFSHTKLFLVDDTWACVGSANWDMRSFHLQFDSNIGVVSPDFVDQVRAVCDEEIAASRQIRAAEFLPRPAVRGLAERAAALFEDLL